MVCELALVIESCSPPSKLDSTFGMLSKLEEIRYFYYAQKFLTKCQFNNLKPFQSVWTGVRLWIKFTTCGTRLHILDANPTLEVPQPLCRSADMEEVSLGVRVFVAAFSVAAFVCRSSSPFVKLNTTYVAQIETW